MSQSSPETETVDVLQSIHNAINALGGSSVQDNSYDQGIVDTVAKALEIIERAQARGFAQDPLVQKIGAEARRYAEMYPQSSDGRNTFVIFADWVAALALSSTDRPKCKLCGLEDGACICAHIPQRKPGCNHVWYQVDPSSRVCKCERCGADDYGDNDLPLPDFSPNQKG